MRPLTALLLAASAAPLASPLPAQTDQRPIESGLARRDLVPGSRVSVTPGARYRAGWLHRLVFGTHNRELWTTPVQVEVLDLATYDGGLKVLRRSGTLQTKGLRLESSDGRQYAFRSVDKDPSPQIPEELRQTLVHDILQDQMSAGHPGGALVVPPLLDAAGVRGASPRLFVLPDDPSLGEFRAEFAGVLGTLEERPTDESKDRPGFLGARKVANSEELFERLDGDPEEGVDARAYLVARLMDVFLGDRDRHAGQWQWIKLEAEGAWLPVAYDRDEAFSHYDGLLLDLARMTDFPQLVTFGDKYPSMLGLNWNARFIDRRLLAGLDRAVWNSVAQSLQSRLTDEVIDRAVRRLPPEQYEKDGIRLTDALEQRRDQLPEAAERFYRLLADEVEVRATKRADRVVARRGEDGSLELTVADAATSGHAKQPYFRRRFNAAETDEVRIYLLDGPDSVSVDGSRGPALRIIGGGGTDVVTASSGGVRLYDTDRDSRPIGAGWDRRPYSPPDSSDHVEPAIRDWGGRRQLLPWAQYEPETGVFFGASQTWTDYGFRKDPYSSRWRLSAGYATSASAPRVVLDGDLRTTNSPLRFLVHARASGADLVRYFGFGNESPFSEPRDFFRVGQEQYELALGIGWASRSGLTFDIGPLVRYATTDLDEPSLVNVERPYGSDNFGQVGAWSNLAYDTRDYPRAATRGVYLSLGGSVFPEVWDVQSTYGEVHGEASTYLTASMPLRPTLALRAGGKYVFGDLYPFFDAAYVGGATTVRGLRDRRFIGDYSAYGNAELRLSLGRARIVVPTEVGIFGLADAGRVWLEGEDSNDWHEAFGGGVWFAFLNRANVISMSLARGDGRTAFYLTAGFGY